MNGNPWDDQPEGVGVLPLTPAAPDAKPPPAVVVLGRFQPFHCGHESLVNYAIAQAESSGMRCRIAIGSSNRGESLDNPWTWQERQKMIEVWLGESAGQEVDIVAIPDINDPPNWVAHAEQYHGEAGIIVTSDESTAELYSAAGWEVVSVPLEGRESWEGWRIRSTCKMLSTVDERDAALSVMGATIPLPVAEFLWDEGMLKRLAFLGRPFEPVG